MCDQTRKLPHENADNQMSSSLQFATTARRGGCGCCRRSPPSLLSSSTTAEVGRALVLPGGRPWSLTPLLRAATFSSGLFAAGGALAATSSSSLLAAATCSSSSLSLLQSDSTAAFAFFLSAALGFCAGLLPLPRFTAQHKAQDKAQDKAQSGTSNSLPGSCTKGHQLDCAGD